MEEKMETTVMTIVIVMLITTIFATILIIIIVITIITIVDPLLQSLQTRQPVSQALVLEKWFSLKKTLNPKPKIHGDEMEVSPQAVHEWIVMRNLRRKKAVMSKVIRAPHA